MKFYIGTNIHNVKAHNALRDKLIALGHEITHDFTRHLLAAYTTEYLTSCAVDDTRGIYEADFIVVMLPAGRGTHFEMGFAVALGIPVFLLATNQQLWPSTFTLSPETPYPCAFHWHPCVTKCADEAAVLQAVQDLEATLFVSQR